MFKKLFFISILFLSSSIFANTENQTNSNLETTEQESSSIKKRSKNLDYLLELYANDKWGFMGKKFIDEFYEMFDEREKLKNLKKFKRGAVILGAYLLLMSLFPPIIILFLIEATVTYLIYTIKLENINDNINRRDYSIFKNFLKKWQKYKKITPKELHPLFEKIILEIENLNHTELLEIISEIQDQVIKNDPKYYELFKKETNPVSKKNPINPVIIYSILRRKA